MDYVQRGWPFRVGHAPTIDAHTHRIIGSFKEYGSRTRGARLGLCMGAVLRELFTNPCHAHAPKPIKEVAHLVGISEARHFNKTMRKYFGRAESALRLSQPGL